MPSRQSRNGDLHQERRSSSPSSDFKFGLLTLCCFLLTSLLLMLVLGWTTSARESSQMRTSALLISGDLQFCSFFLSNHSLTQNSSTVGKKVENSTDRNYTLINRREAIFQIRMFIHPSNMPISTAKCKKTGLAHTLAKKSTASTKISTDGVYAAAHFYNYEPELCRNTFLFSVWRM